MANDPKKVTKEMLEAAMEKAVQTGMLPKYVDQETALINWASMKSVVQAALDLAE